MGIIQDQLLKGLSTAFNTSVTCDDLDVAPLRGTVTLTNLAVAAGAGDTPLATIPRATAKLSLAKVLGGNILISEANIDGLRLHLARDASGEWNFPGKRSSFAKPQTTTKPQKKQPTVEIDKLLFVDAHARFVHSFKNGMTYELLAAPILASLVKRRGGYDMTFIVDKITRTDTGADLGSCKVSAKLDGAVDLMRISEMALSLIAEIDSRASAELNATSIGSGPCQFKANADLDVATLKSAVPGALLERMPGITGNIALHASGAFDRTSGLRVEDASIRLQNSQITFG